MKMSDSSALTTLIGGGLAFFAEAAAYAEPAAHIPESGCGEIMYGDYEPRPIHSLDELAPKARSELTAYLKDRLGTEYVAKLSLVGGQIIDRAELLAKEPESVEYEWRPPKYNVFFDFTGSGEAPAICASIELDLLANQECPHYFAVLSL